MRAFRTQCKGKAKRTCWRTRHLSHSLHSTNFFFCLFRVPPAAYRSSQVRSLDRAAAAKPIPQPQQHWIQACLWHHSSQQCQILNPLGEARDWTHVLITIERQRELHRTNSLGKTGDASRNVSVLTTAYQFETKKQPLFPRAQGFCKEKKKKKKEKETTSEIKRKNSNLANWI